MKLYRKQFCEAFKKQVTSRCSSGVEHFLGKEEAKGSNPFNGSKD